MLLRSIAVYLSIVVATLVGAEVLARVYEWSSFSRDIPQGDSLGRWRYDFSHTGFGDLQPNQNGLWISWFHRPYHVQTNSVGLRNVEEPSDKAFRIYVVGDSQTFGAYVANEDAWPAWTENYLRKSSGREDQVQVFNAGVSGYTILDELALIKQKGVAFKPDLIVLGVYENDLYDLRKEQQDGFVQRSTSRPPSQLDETLRQFGRNFALLSVVDQVRTRIKFSMSNVDIFRGEGEQTRSSGPAGAEQPQQAQPDPQLEKLIRRYRELYLDLATTLKTHRIPFAVVFLPSADRVFGGNSAMEPVIRQLTGETGTPYFDVTGAMRSYTDPVVRLYLVRHDVKSARWVGNEHYSREGHAAIGNAVAGWLSAQGYLRR